jgi:hypothetical protein
MSPAPVMAGFAFITGVFGCFNHRVLDPVQKPKTVTFDAEIPIGENDEGELQCVKGILHYFDSSHEKSPLDDRKYFLSGKVVSISQVDDKENVDYDLQIEALTVRSSVSILMFSLTDNCTLHYLTLHYLAFAIVHTHDYCAMKTSNPTTTIFI